MLKKTNSCHLFTNSTPLLGRLPQFKHNNCQPDKKEKILKEKEVYKQMGFLSEKEIEKKIKILKELVVKKNNFLENYNKTATSAFNLNKTSANFFRTHTNFTKPYSSELALNGDDPFMKTFKTDKNNNAFLTNLKKNYNKVNPPDINKAKMEKVFCDKFSSFSKSLYSKLINIYDSNKISDHTSCIHSNIRVEGKKNKPVGTKNAENRLKTANKLLFKRLASLDNLDSKQLIKNSLNEIHPENYQNPENPENPENINNYDINSPDEKIKEKIEEPLSKESKKTLRPISDMQSSNEIGVDIDGFLKKAEKEFLHIGCGLSPLRKANNINEFGDDEEIKLHKPKVNIKKINEVHRRIFNNEYDKNLKGIKKKQLWSQTDIDYDLPKVKQEFYFMKSTIDYIYGKYLLAKSKEISKFKNDQNKFLINNKKR